MSKNEIILLAAEAGKIILENGGETYRVEQTIKIICTSYGLKNAEAFVTPTGIMISAVDEDNDVTSIIKRIEKREINLEKISEVNELSRKINSEKLSLENVREQLHRINDLKHYSKSARIFFSAITTSFFTLLFSGNMKDFFVAFIIGLVMSYFIDFFNKHEVNSFFINFLGGFFASIVALFSVYLGIGMNEDKIIIGSIMLLVPGLAITNAIRDTIAGDLVSGISRSIEAVFVAVAISIGTGSAFKIWIILFGGI